VAVGFFKSHVWYELEKMKGHTLLAVEEALAS